MVAKIWVVDDEEPVREVLGAMLQQMGHETRLFSDAKSLVAAYRRRRVDLVLADRRMPVMDGLALVRALRDKDPDAIVVIVTGYPSVEDGVEATRLGAADYLTKPLRMEEIRLRIMRVLEIRDLQTSLRRSRVLAWLLIGSLPFWFVIGLFLHMLVGCP